MFLRANEIERNLNRRLWAQLISPRPIALITSLDRDGVRNIAPYNSFAGLSTHPPIIGVSFGQRDGHDKTTLRNIKEQLCFAVNLVPRFLAENMNEAARESEEQDDFLRLGLTPEPCKSIQGFRIAECPATLECRSLRILPLDPGKAELVVAAVDGIVLRDEFALFDGSFDNLSADLLASIGVEDYITVNGELLHLPIVW